MSFFKNLFGSLFRDPAEEFNVAGAVHGGRPIASWYHDLSDVSHATREAAEDALVAIGEPAIPALVAACAAPTIHTRLAAASGLGRIGALALDAVFDLMLNPDARLCASVAFARMGPAALGHLQELLAENDEAEVQEGVAHVVADLAHSLQVETSRPAPTVDSGDPLQPRRAASVVRNHAAVEQPGPKVEWDFTPFADSLFRMLGSSSASPRREAARALWHIGKRGARPDDALGAALQDEECDIRLYAAGALAELDSHTSEAIAVVAGALGASSEAEATLAVHVVQSFHPDAAAAAVEPLVACLLHRSDTVRYHAKLALAHLGDVAVPALLDAARDANADLRRRAASVLGDMRQQYAIFENSLDSAPTETELRARVEGIRRRLPDIVRALIALADDADLSVAERAVRALGFGALSRIPSEVLSDYVGALEKHDRIAFRDLVAAALHGTPEQRRDLGVPLMARLDPPEREELVYEFLRDMVREPQTRPEGLRALRELDIDAETFDSLVLDIDLWVSEEAPQHKDQWQTLKAQISREFTESE